MKKPIRTFTTFRNLLSKERYDELDRYKLIFEDAETAQRFTFDGLEIDKEGKEAVIVVRKQKQP